MLLAFQVFTPECWLQVFFKLVEQDHDPSNNSNSVAQPDVLSDSMQTNWLHSQMRQLACIHIVKQVRSTHITAFSKVCPYPSSFKYRNWRAAEYNWIRWCHWSWVHIRSVTQLGRVACKQC